MFAARAVASRLCTKLIAQPGCRKPRLHCSGAGGLLPRRLRRGEAREPAHRCAAPEAAIRGAVRCARELSPLRRLLGGRRWASVPSRGRLQSTPLAGDERSSGAPGPQTKICEHFSGSRNAVMAGARAPIFSRLRRSGNASHRAQKRASQLSSNSS